MCFRLSKPVLHSSHPSLLSPTFSHYKSSSFLPFSSSHSSFKCRRKSVNLFYRLCSNNSKSELGPDDPAGDNGDYTDETRTGGVAAVIEELIPQGNTPIVSACLVGLFTGVSVVLFNYAVHEIRDFCWDGIPYQGASWLREEPIEAKWARVILVPASGGLIVTLLNKIRASIDGPTEGVIMSYIKSALKPILKTVAASVTLGTGNSLGPEGPSVEIGVSIAKGVGAVLDKGAQRKLSLRAAGSAAGLSSGLSYFVIITYYVHTFQFLDSLCDLHVYRHYLISMDHSTFCIENFLKSLLQVVRKLCKRQDCIMESERQEIEIWKGVNKIVENPLANYAIEL